MEEMGIHEVVERSLDYIEDQLAELLEDFEIEIDRYDGRNVVVTENNETKVFSVNEFASYLDTKFKLSHYIILYEKLVEYRSNEFDTDSIDTD